MPTKIRSRLLLLAALLLTALFFLLCGADKNTIANPTEVRKLEYNNPDILVDLDVGFKSVPMPMDFDGDGDYDLLVSESGAYAEAGVFYFENISGNIDKPVFRHRMRLSSERFRLGYDGMCFAVSHVGGHDHVLTPDRVNDKLLMYVDVPQNVFWKKTELSLPATGYISGTKYNTWKLLDFDADGVLDLVCGLSSTQGAFLLFFKNMATDDNSSYAAPDILKTENGEPIGRSLRLETALADYDGDDDYDYIAVGPFGDFIYFENKGEPGAYKFAVDKKLMHDGKALQMECRYGHSIKVRVIDWNEDGFVDLLAGDEDGKVSFIKNTGRVKDGLPEFLPPQFFQQQAKYVDFGALTTPRVYDWDGDGRDDIISGDGAGYIGFFKNLGGASPKWAGPELLQADGEVIRILPPDANWGYVTIDVGDWNMDGLPDILSNDYDGHVLWFENIGARKNPKLAAAMPIEVQWQGAPQKPAWTLGTSKGNELLAPWRTSPFIMDYNNDGLNDLVMLDYQGYLAVYLRYKGENGELLLAHPQRNFIYPTGEPILLNQRTGSSCGRLKITFADWDGDGLKDLIFSSKPAVDWMKNIGMKDGKMQLQYMGRIVSRTLMGHTDGPVVADWNRDGVPDLLVGTETGVFYYWQRPSFQVTTTMTSDGVQAPANYRYFKR